ncbi:site-specific integrase [Ancylobacter amanitiformis]|uniref:Integrase n=1 Tax=Ancylobacter amanitiformis TaxID=217069 RepID=A0ABU0LPJ9_9HYPH|nr:site-specific integrase [Ancylobacter amanitiformis]MDQ0510634.1 integrase [Ancylobacter amanitiformis]
MKMAYPPPKRDPKSGNWRFRKVVPERLRQQIGRGEIVRWLGTNAAEARKLNADLHLEWDAKFASLSKGVTTLTRKQARALAGRWYRWFVASREDDPGTDPEGWLLTLETLRDLEPHGGVVDDGSDMEEHERPRGPRTTQRVHAFLHDHGNLAQFFLNEGVTLADGSRPIFMEEMEEEFFAAHHRLMNLARGDYRKDDRLEQFPEWKHPAPAATAPVKAAKASADKLTLPALFNLWKAGNPQASPGTIKVYAPKIEDCDAFLEGPDARTISVDDIWRWAEHRLTVKKLSPKTVRDNDIAALKSVMGWATTREGGRLLISNPAAEVKMKAVKQVREREPVFREAEVRAILRAALAVTDDPKNPTKAFARRWVPWLCAYTGARVREITQLRGADIYQEAGVWVMNITPEAGTVKNGHSRRAFLHEHLLELGFPEFVRARGQGPLFYDPERRTKADAKTSQAEVQAIHLAAWVRKEAKLDARLNPNHAWRHTFKTRLLEAGVEQGVRDLLVGHTVFGVARSYEHASATFFAAELNKAPRYSLEDAPSAGANKLTPREFPSDLPTTD